MQPKPVGHFCCCIVWGSVFPLWCHRCHHV